MSIANNLQTLEVNSHSNPVASVIWLHGLGASGHDFYDIVPKLNLPKNFAVRFVFPHAPFRNITYADDAKMRAWFNFIDLDPKTQEDIIGILESQESIGQLIEKEIIDHNVQSNKIVLAGFSQGGAIALQCGLRYPKQLAGVLVLSSWLPLADKVSDELNKANKKTPIAMMHGTSDDLIQISLAQKGYEFLKKLGCNITFNSYSMQHEVCDSEVAEIGLWLRKVFAI